MRIPIIKIREQRGGKATERLVGTNVHDVLSVEHGGIYYTNIQCMMSTKYPEESGMTFVAENKGEYSFTGYPEIEMVSVDEYLDIIEKQVMQEAKDEIETQKLFKKILSVRETEEEADHILKDYDNEEGLIPHT